jgi:catechol 2,3-dioxygenase-like lactoylglutathione lyase family enzyme
MTHPVLRLARPTDDLDALLPFYRDGLGLSVLASFRDHDGFDGLILGASGATYHLEFTRAHGHVAGRAPSPDNPLVLYEPDRQAWVASVERMRVAGFAPVPAFNPWWDKHGATFEDPDGWRVVLWQGAWSP